MQEVFRFGVLRSVQLATLGDIGVRVLPLAAEGIGVGPLQIALTKLDGTSARREAAEEYLASPGFVADPDAVPFRWRMGYMAFISHRAEPFEKAPALIKTVYGKSADALVKDDSFIKSWHVLGDSCVAALLAMPRAEAAVEQLSRALRTLGVIIEAAHVESHSESRRGAKKQTIADVLNRRIVAPARALGVNTGVEPFDLPRTSAPRRTRIDKRETDSGSSSRLAARSPADEAAVNLENTSRAAAELTREVRHHVTQTVDSRPLPAGDGLLSRYPTSTGPALGARPVSRMLIAPERLNQLSAPTRAALEDASLDLTRVSLHDAVNALESRAMRIGEELYRPAAPQRVTRIGTGFVNVSAPPPMQPVAHALTGVPSPLGGASGSGTGTGTSGGGSSTPAEPVRPVVIVGGDSSAPGAEEVPRSTGIARPLGVMDLEIVRQKLLRYEPGEVAHIENALRGEFRERTHRRLTRREEISETETERREEGEFDLQTTERFELQQESERTIQEDVHLEAGVTVNAKYGPFVEVTANAGFARDTSREETDRRSTSYAREVTQRSVKKIQERVRQLRRVTLITEVEEKNLHGLDNKAGAGHVTGIYRWVDKVYEAQVFRYDKRFFFEFIVPEPGAFYRHSLVAKTPEGLLLEKPDAPTVGVGTSLRPLSPADLVAQNYAYFVAKYNVAGVKPPPPQYKTAATTLSDPAESGSKILHKTSTELKAPDGYRAIYAYVRALIDPAIFYGSGPWSVWVNVGRQSVFLQSTTADLKGETIMGGEDDVIPLGSVARNTQGFSLNVEVVCERSEAELRKWQQDTFDAIVAKYLTLKSEYDDALRSAELQEGIAIEGRNPLENRDIERRELKKHAIAMLTGQRYDLFDATRNRSPQGYPEMDFPAADAEGRFIQFFEQCFEWQHSVYRFYPYFWARKDQWVDLAGIQDVDPNFQAFLQAGSARLVVPVRPGYLDAVRYFVQSGGDIWEGGDPPTVDDELFLSIIAEIEEDLGRDQGTPVEDPWIVRVPTSLVVLQQDAQLPVLDGQ